VERLNVCIGCGAALQSEHKDRPGYVPPAATGREPAICQRCFRIRHYNEVSPVALDEGDFLRILNSVGERPGLVVHIVDLFDFEGSLIGGLSRFARGNPILLVVNKVDLLPKNVNRNRIRNWVQKQAKAAGLKPVDTVLISARKGEGMDPLLHALSARRKGKDIFVVGATNVGKSSLINRLIRDYSELDAELTVSRYPGTTLDLVHIPLDDGGRIVDTPGIVYKWRLTELLHPADLAAVVPGGPLKPLVYQLEEQQTLFFGALARVDFVRGDRQPFICYVAGGLKVHRTKLARADELYAAHRGEMLVPPAKERLDQLPPWTRHALTIPPGREMDILISGLGWVRAGGASATEVVVHAPRGVKVILRDAIL
jgi:hypothetical protein